MYDLVVATRDGAMLWHWGATAPPNFFGNLIYIDTSLIFDSKIYTLSPLQNIYKLPHETSKNKK